MSATLEAVPVDSVQAPNGVLHVIRQDPDIFDTLCGMNVRTAKGKPSWTFADEVQSNTAICLPCRLNLRRAQEGADEWGNFLAREGEDTCECGYQFWENDHCTQCGGEWHPEYRGEDGDV